VVAMTGATWATGATWEAEFALAGRMAMIFWEKGPFWIQQERGPWQREARRTEPIADWDCRRCRSVPAVAAQLPNCCSLVRHR